MIIDSVGGKADTNTTVVTLAPVATVTLSPPSATITLNKPDAYGGAQDANGNTLTGRPINWAAAVTPSNHRVADWYCLPVSPGTDTSPRPCRRLNGHSQRQATITVTFLVPVASVTLSPPPRTITLNPNADATAVLKDATEIGDRRNITWTSSNHGRRYSVAEWQFGLPVSPGTDTITVGVSTQCTVSGSSVITVTLVPVASVTVNPPSATISADPKRRRLRRCSRTPPAIR